STRQGAQQLRGRLGRPHRRGAGPAGTPRRHGHRPRQSIHGTRAAQKEHAMTNSDELAPDLAVTYDLIICHDERIVFHDHYESPDLRLRMCVGLLTDSNVVSRVLDGSRAAEVRDVYQALASRWSTAPDSVVDAIAKCCRTWGVHVYVSTTRKKNMAPATLFTVVTEYGPGQTVAEHFPSREA